MTGTELSPEQDPKTFSFWQKRLLRALILGGLLLVAARILRNVPEDQRIEILAPPGAVVSEARLSYALPDDSEPLSGSTQNPKEPAPRLLFQTSLANGEYRVEVEAKGTLEENGARTSHVWRVSRVLHLDGATTRLELRP